MKEAITFLICFLSVLLKMIKPGGGKAIAAENLAIKQQLIVIKRKSKVSKSPPLTPFQRIFFSFLSYFMSEDQIKQMAVIISPNTIFKYHQLLKKRKYRLLFSSNNSQRRLGPKGPSKEVIDAVVEMKRRNPRMGCPKIALTISKVFGIDIDKDKVRRILSKYYHPNPFDHHGPSWLTFLGQAKDSLWSLDLFRAESIHLKTHWIMLVMDQYTRKIVALSAFRADALCGANVCAMFNKIIGKHLPPCAMLVLTTTLSSNISNGRPILESMRLKK